MSKSKPCFKILGKKAFRWHLETQENQIGCIFKFKLKKRHQIPKKICTLPPFPPPPPPGNISLFWNLTPLFDFKFKNTSNVIFLGFKGPSESFFPKNFKTVLTFWHMYFFFHFQNLVRSCQHISGTPCISPAVSNCYGTKYEI